MNLITKNNNSDDIDYKKLRNCLIKLRSKLADLKLEKFVISKNEFINMDWTRVKSIIESVFKERNFDIYVYYDKLSKNKSGRPRLANNFSLFSILLLFFMFNSSVGNEINEKFKFCKTVKSPSSSNPIITLDSICDESPKRYERILTENDVNNFFWSSNYFRVNFLTKLKHEVNGMGWECSQVLVKVSTSTNFFRARSVNIERRHVLLERSNCINMLKTKMCGLNKMSCEGDNCKYDIEPIAKYCWLSSFVETGITCSIKSKLILADKIETKLFGLNCYGKKLFCKTSNSIIVWENNILYECPYDWVFRDDNAAFMHSSRKDYSSGYESYIT